MTTKPEARREGSVALASRFGLRSLIPLEPKLLAARDLVRRDRRADEFFDVLDDEAGALKVADLRYHRRFEHRLGRYAELIGRDERQPVLEGVAA